jgi:hypothetical protein
MADLFGTNVAGGIYPFTTNDDYETHDATYGKGGFRAVVDLAARNAITTKRRSIGMLVFVISEGVFYNLQGGISNNDWVTTNFSEELDPVWESEKSNYYTKTEVDNIITPVYYVPYSYNIIKGTLIYGDLASIQTLADDDNLKINEVTGTPGYDIEFDFSDISKFNKLWAHLSYTGTGGHTIDINIYNYNTASWDKLTDFTLSPGFQFIEIPIISDADYISDGNSKITLYHTASGNPAHTLFIDYIGLTYSGTGVSNEHGALFGLSDPDHPISAIQGLQSTLDEKSNAFNSGEADENILQGQPLYVKNNGHVALGKAVLGYNKFAGLAHANTNSGISAKYQPSGLFTMSDWTSVIGVISLTPGETYYLSDANFGEMTSNPSTLSGFCVKIGIALNTTTIEINNNINILL